MLVTATDRGTQNSESGTRNSEFRADRQVVADARGQARWGRAELTELISKERGTWGGHRLSSAALDCTCVDILNSDKATLAAVSITVETLKTVRTMGVAVEPMKGIGGGRHRHAG